MKEKNDEDKNSNKRSSNEGRGK